MTLREQIDIKATPERIWPWLADPSLWPRWQQKVVHLERSRNGLVIPGEQFRAVFQLKKRRNDSQIEVKICEPPSKLLFRQFYTHKNRVRRGEMEFELRPVGERTRLMQTIDFSGAGVPFLLGALVWMIHRFGRTVGPQPLEELKELIENSPTPAGP